MLVKEATERRYVVMITSLIHPLLSGIVRVCISDQSKMVGTPALSHFQIPCFNSLTPGKIEWNFIFVIFKQILVIDGWGISCEIALIWMSLDFTDDQSTLVQVMAWCRQQTSHYLSQCWPRSLSPYGVTRPQWVNGELTPRLIVVTLSYWNGMLDPSITRGPLI